MLTTRVKARLTLFAASIGAARYRAASYTCLSARQSLASQSLALLQGKRAIARSIGITAVAITLSACVTPTGAERVEIEELDESQVAELQVEEGAARETLVVDPQTGEAVQGAVDQAESGVTDAASDATADAAAAQEVTSNEPVAAEPTQTAETAAATTPPATNPPAQSNGAAASNRIVIPAADVADTAVASAEPTAETAAETAVETAVETAAEPTAEAPTQTPPPGGANRVFNAPERGQAPVVELDTPQGERISISAEEAARLNEADSKLDLATRADTVDDINEKITLASLGIQPGSSINRAEYRLGAGDVIEIAVFQVDELNRKVRISGDGYIMIPLLGQIKVDGMTTSELEQELATRLEKDFLHNPQVSTFVTEFRAHQVAVLGEVEQPNVYTINEPSTILQMIAKAGGIKDTAGSRVFVRHTIEDQNGQRNQESLVIDLKLLVESNDERLMFPLANGDSVHIPKAGTVFVEGAVASPGAYPIKGDTNVLKALAMAGGTEFDAAEGGIKVYRKQANGEVAVFDVDLDSIRESRDEVALQDGDIVVVNDDAFKSTLSTIWNGFTSIFSLGKSL